MGNISRNPNFLSADSGDYRLDRRSPCVDAGFGSDDVPDTDLDGNRRVDDPRVPNSGAGEPDYVDMGAYERARIRLKFPRKR